MTAFGGAIGWTGWAPWMAALVGAGALGVLVALYAAGRRRPRQVVASVALWAQARCGRMRRGLRRLRVPLALVLLGAAALALSFAPARPVWTPHAAAGGPLRPQCTLLAVDVSASMGATDVPGGRLSRALSEAWQAVTRASADASFAVAAADRDVRVVLPWTRDRAAVARALSSLRVRATGSDLSSVVARLAELARAGGECAAVLWTDGVAPEPAPALPRVRVALVGGQATGSVGVGALSVRLQWDDPLLASLHLGVFNTMPHAVSVVAELWSAWQGRTAEAIAAEGEPFAVRMLHLEPGGRAEVDLHDLLLDGDRVAVRLRRDDGRPLDALPLDDTAVALVPDRRPLRVSLRGSVDPFVRAALAALPQVDVLAADSGEAPDLVVVEGTAPPWPPAVPTLAIAPRAAPWVEGTWSPSAPVEGRVLARGAPWLERLEGETLRVWPVVRLASPRRPSRALVRAAHGEVLVAYYQPLGGGPGVVAWAFDPVQSPVALHSAFPVLVANAVRWAAGERRGAADPARAGVPLATPLPHGVRAGTRRAQLEGPDGWRRRVPVAGGRVLWEAFAPGIYTIEAAGRTTRVAVQWRDDVESALRGGAARALARWEPPSRTARRTSTPVRRPLWVTLLVAAAVLLAVEAFTWHQGWTR